jgi:hypothetical protein
MLSKSGITKLRKLADDLRNHQPKIASSLDQIIFEMVTKAQGATISIEDQLLPAIQDYYQLLLDSSQYNNKHWENTLRGHLKNIIKANDAPKYRDKFFLDDQQINEIINQTNEQGFIDAVEHLKFDLELSRKYYNDNLTIDDLFAAGGIEKPVWKRKYNK